MGYFVKDKMDHRDGGVILEPRRDGDDAPFMDNAGRRYGWRQVTNDDLDLFDADGEKRERARDDCTCVVNCADDPATACSLSGQWHVHPDDGRGLFGVCPTHPEAPGDL